MKITYTVSKEKGGMYYAHAVGFPNVPLFGSFSKSKKAALHTAADAMGLPYKEYMKLRNSSAEK